MSYERSASTVLVLYGNDASHYSDNNARVGFHSEKAKLFGKRRII